MESIENRPPCMKSGRAQKAYLWCVCERKSGVSDFKLKTIPYPPPPPPVLSFFLKAKNIIIKENRKLLMNSSFLCIVKSWFIMHCYKLVFYYCLAIRPPIPPYSYSEKMYDQLAEQDVSVKVHSQDRSLIINKFGQRYEGNTKPKWSLKSLKSP